MIFPDDPRFFNPPSMLRAIEEQVIESNQCFAADPPAVAKLILDSLAFRYASVLRTLESLCGAKIEGIQIVGGGSQNDYLNQITADATLKPVIAGPVEATVIGNMLVQAVSAGRFSSLSDARQHISQSVNLKKFTPQQSAAVKERALRYEALEARYLH
ncbi:MAG: FGGY-family carbohydrate kinase [Pyrinomonadaceae bacterium]